MENKDGEGDEGMPYLEKEMLPCNRWRGKAQRDKEEEETGACKAADGVRLTEAWAKEGLNKGREGFS